MDDPAIAVVVPVLNEAELLPGFLDHLRQAAPGCEYVIVDGGSTDGSPGLVHAPARILTSDPGRARQMNAGAAASRADVLWFLHVDSRLPEHALPALLEALRDPRLAGGCFRIRIPRGGMAYRIADDLGNLGVDLFRISLGDHGIFARRRDFEAAGGFPDVPLMEDAELYRGLRRRGRVRQLPLEIVTSPRQWERHGPARTTAVYWLILALYVAGTPLPVLARIHRRFFSGR